MIDITNLENLIARKFLIVEKGTLVSNGEKFVETKKYNVPIIQKEYDTEDEAVEATVLWLREKHKDE